MIILRVRYHTATQDTHTHTHTHTHIHTHTHTHRREKIARKNCESVLNGQLHFTVKKYLKNRLRDLLDRLITP